MLDQEGKTDCGYSTDESLAGEITDYLQKDVIMDFTGYEERTYSNGLKGKTGHMSTLQLVPEKMHRVSLRSTITHLLNLPETIP